MFSSVTDKMTRSDGTLSVWWNKLYNNNHDKMLILAENSGETQMLTRRRGDLWLIFWAKLFEWNDHRIDVPHCMTWCLADKRPFLLVFRALFFLMFY